MTPGPAKAHPARAASECYDRDMFYTFAARGYTYYPLYEQRSESLASTLQWWKTSGRLKEILVS